MQEIHIKLWRHIEAQDWSAEVDGRLHEHVSTTTVNEFVEYVLVAAQQALLKPEATPGKSAMPETKWAPSRVAKAGTSGIHIVAKVS
jgi:hypothetical protein